MWGSRGEGVTFTWKVETGYQTERVACGKVCISERLGEGGDCLKHYAMWNLLWVSGDIDY